MDQQDKPFSSQWYAAPASRRLARRVGAHLRYRVVRTLDAVPDAPRLRILTLCMLVLASTWFVYPRTILPVNTEGMRRNDLISPAMPTAEPGRPHIGTGKIDVAAGNEIGPLSRQESMQKAFTQPQPEATTPADDGSLLPKNRILLIYGLPGDPSFGMLASYDNQRLIEILQGHAAEFEEIDPDRPIILGLHVVASAGQSGPGRDHQYLRDTSVSTIYSYIEFTRRNNMVLFLEVQIGRSSVPDEVPRMQRFLQQAHVHLAIDPQFDVQPTELPTVDQGSTTAAHIAWTQEYLVDLAASAGIPAKILLVHQFTDEMIVNKPLIRPLPGVQLVINVGLWGSPEQKSGAYKAFVVDQPVEFGGIMVSGTWDGPVLTTAEILNLPSAPDVVIYQ